MEEKENSVFAELAAANEEETTTDSQTETVDETPAPSQEEQKAEKPEDSASKKEVPFHKHPRWIALQDELKELRAQAAERGEKVSEVKVDKTITSVPPQFQALFGEDVEAYKQYEGMQRAIAREELEQHLAAERQREETMRAQEEQAKKMAVNSAEEQFSELAEETGIDFTDKSNTERNQILDICLKYSLFDETGMPKVREAAELREALYPKQSDEVLEEKKRVITKTNGRGNAPIKSDDVITPSKLKKMRMSDFLN